MMSQVKSPQGSVAGSLPRMGGMALRNGLILVSERHWAAAVRDAAGVISVASGLKTRVPLGTKEGGSGGIPLLRGLSRFGETLMVLAQAKMNLPNAELPIEGARVVAALGAALGANATIKALAPKSPVVQEVGGALASFVPAVLAVKNSPIAGYHGAEHKVIGAREAMTGLGQVASALAGSSARSSTPESGSGLNVAAANKVHDRCGSNIIGPLLLATVVTNLVVRGRSGRKSPVASVAAGAVSLGLALEGLRWSTTHEDSPIARAFLYPGRLVQRVLTTKEPTPGQLEVAERAIRELLRLEGVAG
jgi:uncharacterized protein YqhQ